MLYKVIKNRFIDVFLKEIVLLIKFDLLNKINRVVENIGFV